jgi:hypothetical protein
LCRYARSWRTPSTEDTTASGSSPATSRSPGLRPTSSFSSSKRAGEQALSVGYVRLKGRSSGAVTEVTGAAAWSMRDERLLRMAYHPTVPDARRELGWDS